MENRLNCKTDISAALPQNTDTIHMDLMTDEELHAKLQKGYDDIEAGKVQNAVEAFTKFKAILDVTKEGKSYDEIK